MRARSRDPGFLLMTLFLISVKIVNSAVLYGQVEEDAPGGTVVSGIILERRCQDSNLAELKPTLTGGFSSGFALECLENTGLVLKTTKTFDEESESSYTLSFNNAIENMTIIIHIVPKNDNTKAQWKDARIRGRMPRAVSEELSYTVTVSENAKVGDLIFTVPEQRFEKKWFEVLSEGISPVRMERESGRVFLAQRLVTTAEVMVKIHNMRGKTACLLPHSRL